MGGREITVPQGRLLGGSAGINGLSFAPAASANADALAKLGIDGWGWDDFSKSLAKSYSLDGAEGGPIQVSYPRDLTENGWNPAWHSTLASLGFAKEQNAFGGKPIGSLDIPDAITGASRTRSYSANAYLLPAKAKDNLTVWTETLVKKIDFDASQGGGDLTATGVTYTDTKGETKTVKATKEVILSAGAINSPKILELSGVGGSPLLKSLGIDVVIENPHVGENLQNHIICGMSFQANDDAQTLDSLARQVPEALAKAQAQFAQQVGPFASGGINTSALLPFPDICSDQGKSELEKVLSQTSGFYESTATDGFAKAHTDFVHSILRSPEETSASYMMFPGFAAFQPDGTMAPPPQGDEKYLSVALLLSYPLSRGSVHIKDASAETAPAIDPRYLSHPLDTEILARHLGYLEKISSTGALAEKLVKGGKRVPEQYLGDNIEAAKEFVRKTVVGAHHYNGTCSMMAKDLGGVVDQKLRVYGSRNLRVCDASVIPLAPRSNPQSTIYGFAEHAASIIKADVVAQ